MDEKILKTQKIILQMNEIKEQYTISYQIIMLRPLLKTFVLPRSVVKEARAYTK